MGADIENKSKIELLDPPEFKSTIPAHMLAKLAEQDRWLSQTVSEMEQRETWLISVCQENRRHLIDVDTMARAVYTWKQKWTSRWGILAMGFVLFAPVVFKTLLEHWLKKQ